MARLFASILTKLKFCPKTKKFPNYVQTFANYWMNPTKIAKYIKKFAKLTKFRQIWSHWFRQLSFPHPASCSEINKMAWRVNPRAFEDVNFKLICLNDWIQTFSIGINVDRNHLKAINQMAKVVGWLQH